MNYIISPSWFYWISVADGLRTALLVVVIVFGIASCVLVPMAIYEKHEYGGLPQDGGSYDRQCLREMNLVCKWSKTAFFATIVFLILLILIPSRNTLIEMQIAKYATYENAQWTLETLKSAVDYIVNAIKSVK